MMINKYEVISITLIQLLLVKIINQTNFNCFNEKLYWILILVSLFILVMGRYGIYTIL